MSTQTNSYDTIVVGLGGMGAAATYHLAKRDQQVLGLEQFDIPHTKGSSHGITRIIRKSYPEGEEYVPLLQRAYKLWEDLNETQDRRLFELQGSITAGPKNCDLVRDAIQTCKTYDISYQILDNLELTDRYPGYDLPDGYKALYQPDGGFLFSERCITAHALEARAHGADIRGQEPVIDWMSTSEGVKVKTEQGRYYADNLVLSGGSWMPDLVDPLSEILSPERQVLGWFQPTKPEYFIEESFPVFSLDTPDKKCYGFPEVGIPGFKIGISHHLEENVDPDDMEREPTDRDEKALRRYVDSYFPAANGPTMSLHTCLFTNSPDEDFVIDRHPADSQVVFAGGFSGHGYKFCSVVGEILADLSVDGETHHDINPFSLRRLH